MTAFGRGEGFLDADDPIRVLVVGRAEDAAGIQNAALSDGLALDSCETLREAGRKSRVQDYDVTVLVPPFPDAWVADAYSRLRKSDKSSETLVLLEVADEAASMRMAAHPPFAIVIKPHASPELLRRLVLSAALYKRVLHDAPEAVLRSRCSRA